MAHLILSLFTTLSLLLLLLLPSSTLGYDAIFSEPLQILYGGESLVDGDLTLSLSKDCSLVLYDAGVKVLDFNTSVSTKHCALLVNDKGRLQLIPDNERTSTSRIGKKTYPGRYALLFVDGKLGIFGPALWNNGVKGNPYITYPTTTTSNNNQLKTGLTDYILFSGESVSGSANGNVVIAENDKVSALITTYCTLSIKFNGNISIWETGPKSKEPTACKLSLTPNGELLLQRRDESGDVYTQWKGGFASKEKLYATLLRYNGEIVLYGLQTWLYDPSLKSTSAAAAAAAAAIEMVVTD